MANSHYRVSVETRVNTVTDQSQAYSQITGLIDGGWVVTWESNHQGSSHIYQQCYAANGNTVGDETLVTKSLQSFQGLPSITALPDGGWLVTWHSSAKLPDVDIYQQRYNSNGNCVGDEILVNTTTDKTQASSDVTVLADGGWVVTWESEDGSGPGLYQQRYSSNGERVDGENRVNTTTTDAQTSPKVTSLADGGWVVTWQSASGIGLDIYQQRYGIDGIAIGNETLVNTTTESFQSTPSIAALADGGWLVTWHSPDGSNDGIYQQRYTGDGGRIGGEELVNTTTNNNQSSSKVTALADGGWLITWKSYGQDGSLSGIYQQRYGSAGYRLGAENLVNTTTDSYQEYPSVTGLTDGGWVVTWQSFFQDGSGYGIYQQRFMVNKAPSDIGLSASSIAEGSAIGTVVGTISGVDANLTQGDALTYTLVEDAGGRFALAGDKIVVANPRLLDYEQAASHTIQVKASDRDGESITKTFTIQVGDVADEGTLDHAATDGDDVLVGTPGPDHLSGLGGNDTISGLESNDTLDGGVGADVLDGGLGDDTFIVDNPGDTVRDMGGIDTVLSSITYTLSAEIEHLTGKGTLGLTLSGNTSDNIITGTEGHDRLVGLKGDDTLEGLGGHDTLIGGEGCDVLTGGTGRDVFVFDAKIAKTSKLNKTSNLDRITDFSVKDDTIWLKHSLFKKLGKGSEKKPGTLKKDFLAFNSAKDGNDYLIYVKKSGALLYDADGKGGRDPVQIAILPAKLKLTHKDFMIV